MGLGSEESILNRLRRLPIEKQREVLDFVEFLERRTPAQQPSRNMQGALADLGIHLSAEDIDGARQEAWAGFPRTDLK